MKKTKYIITTLFLSLTLCNQVHAACSQEEINEFKKLESRYKVTYEYDNEKEQTIIKYHNPEPQKFIYRLITDDEAYFKIINDYNHIIYGKINGTYTLEIFSTGKNCNETLKTVTIKPPEDFSKDELCKGIEEFVLCQPNYEKKITREEFESRVETYKKSLEKEETTVNDQINKNENSNKNEEKDKNLINDIIDYIKNNLDKIIIIAIFVTLLCINIVYFAIRARKRRRLE